MFAAVALFVCLFLQEAEEADEMRRQATSGLQWPHCTLQLLSRLPAVATMVSISPGHHTAVVQKGSKSTSSCLDLLDTHQLQLPVAATIVTTEPSCRMAAKAVPDLPTPHQPFLDRATVTALARRACPRMYSAKAVFAEGRQCGGRN